MITYETIEAYDWLSDYHKKNATSDYAIVKGDDNKEYQIKFNHSNSREFIAHYIGLKIGVPIPNGKIIYLYDYIFDEIKENIPNINKLPSNYYFGIEWKGNAIKWDTYEEFLNELEKVGNFSEYVSIFPYDQYLRNYDRHEFNHIILKENSNKLFYNSIDSDRIFGGYEYKDILNEINKYNCHYPPKYGKELYSTINDDFFEIMLKYSNVIYILEDKDIADIINICNQLYTIGTVETENIKKFLLERKDKIYDNCLKNSKCYDKVERRLYAN